jgi:hypothetical protein
MSKSLAQSLEYKLDKAFSKKEVAAMERFKVTLYDLLGYLVPGFLTNLVVALYLCYVFEADILLLKFYRLNLVWQLVLGYVSGHLLQAITSFFIRFDFTSWWRRNKWDENLKKKVIEALSAELSMKEKDNVTIDRKTLRLAGAIIQTEAAIAAPEIYRALIGFFRGMTGIFVIMFAVAFLFYVKNFSLPLRIISDRFVLSPKLFGVIAFVSLAFAFISFLRFRYFSAHRSETILLRIYATYLARAEKDRTVDDE